jgi:ubiquinone/menaquinone biosynthesis C-methylase UbiE
MSSQTLRSFFERHPVLKAVVKAAVAPVRGGASRAYQRVAAGESSRQGAALRGAWQSESIPGEQRRLVDQQLAAYRAGQTIPAFDALVRLLEPLVASIGRGRPVSLLEVGCSSGYHSEILAHHELAVAYEGCDYSPSFVEMARAHYPALPFNVADATALPNGDDSVDIVLSGCCLLHIPEYEQAIKESARVARHYVVFHRTPVLHNVPTAHYRKRAYGVETIEIHFNEEELVSLFAKHGLRVTGVVTLDVAWVRGAMYATKEYVCEKVAAGSDGRAYVG